MHSTHAVKRFLKSRNGPQSISRTPRRTKERSVLRYGLGTFGITALSLAMLISFSSEGAFAATTLDLGSATPYAVLAGSTITNTGSSVITGSIGLSPGTSVTGFPPGTVSGTTDVADANSLAAMNSSTAAYTTAAGETPFTTVAAGTLGGMTLVPGVYQSASALSLTGTVTLDGGGDADAVFIFQAGSTLTTAGASSVVLTGGTQACNVFWQVGSSATLGTTTTFNGTILAQTSVTLDTGATVTGRLQAQTGAVTLDGNTVTVPTCLAATPTTTTTTTVPPTTTTTKPHTTTTTAPKKTIIPVGAPETGEGGTAGSGTSMLGVFGLAAIAVSAGASGMALRTRRGRVVGRSVNNREKK